ncbi:hypothetical protein EVB87_005 [Rhizobium phage RHph_N28_1]|nr:hypothetical protein EVB87_005 [Rhizobium phage RHph_N28_1]QIG74033.1 hypothetical protein EVC07_005 [Rhizobium phage RHph_N42]
MVDAGVYRREPLVTKAAKKFIREYLKRTADQEGVIVMRKETQVDVIGQAYKQFRASTTLVEKQHYLARVQALAMDLQKELFQDTMKHIPSNVILTNGDTAAHIKSGKDASKERYRQARRAVDKKEAEAATSVKKPVAKKPVREEPKEYLEGFWYDPKARKETDHLPRVELCTRGRSYAGKSDVTTLLGAVQVKARVNHYKGWSTCRLCGEKNGSKEYSLNGFRWPEGLTHYIDAHNVLVTGEFMSFLLKSVGKKAIKLLEKHPSDVMVRKDYKAMVFGKYAGDTYSI